MRPEPSLLRETSDFIAVDKPAGISVHNNEDPLNLLKVLKAMNPSWNLFPVHRLDKETSGIQILALHEKAARELADEFQTRKVKKIYVGILRGKLKSPGGLWNQPLTDKAEGRKNPAGSQRDRKQTETRFKLIKGNDYFSYCEFDLVTGRQHQIRKHCALVRHTLVGDPRYGEANYNTKISRIYGLDRMFLHCAKIEIAGEQIESPIPIEFEKLLNSI